VQGPAGTAGAQGPAGPAGPQGPSGSPGAGAFGESNWGFAGFTVEDYTGNLDGRPGAHAACAAEFEDAHFCHASEYILSLSTTAIPASGVWIDASMDIDGNGIEGGVRTAGRSLESASCNHWTHASTGFTATVLTQSGDITSVNECGTPRRLACCNGRPKNIVAGFTPTPFTGNVGGWPAVHQACASAFQGSHLAAPIPASGAWIQANISSTGTFPEGGVLSFGRSQSSASCNHYTHAGTSFTGTVLRPSGDTTSVNECGTPRPLVCCFSPE
jgi:hypothetical protein